MSRSGVVNLQRLRCSGSNGAGKVDLGLTEAQRLRKRKHSTSFHGPSPFAGVADHNKDIKWEQVSRDLASNSEDAIRRRSLSGCLGAI
jgi:hypothetical protein